MLEKGISDKVKKLENELVRINKEINKRSEALKTLYLDKINGEITKEQYGEFGSSFEKEKKQFLIKKYEIEATIEELQQGNDEFERYMKLVEKYKSFDKLTHTMVNELIDFIEVGQKDKKSREQAIKIYWNF